MDLRQLRYFAILSEELHFGRAAERLGITQPPLSQAIQALEQELGLRLFERTKRRVALTPVGEQWLPHVRSLLADATALPEIARRLSLGEAGSLRLAFVSIADYSVLPDLVSRYKAACPTVQVSLRESTSDVQIEALLAGEIDAGLIVSPAASLHAALRYRALRHESLVLAVSESHRFRIDPAEAGVPLEAFADEPLIVFPRRSAPAFHDTITGYYTQQGRAPRIGQEAIQMQTIVSLVSSGMGVALVPESMRNLRRSGVRYLALLDAPEIELGLVWRRESIAPTLRRFMETAFSEPLL